MNMKWMLLNTTYLCRSPEDGTGAGEIAAEPIEGADDPTDDDQGVVAPAVAEVEGTAPEWTEEEAEEARVFGWKAPDEWGGEKPPTYVGDPRSFMERIQNSKPFKVLTDRQAKLEADHAERARKMDEMNSVALKAQREKYESDMTSITTQQRRAVELADTDTFDRLEKQRTSMAPPAEAPAPAANAYVQEYAKTNEWVNNPILRDAGSQIINANPAALAMTPQDQIAYAEQEVRKLYPAAFPAVTETPATTTASRQRVDGGGLGSAAAQAKDPFNKLPAEAKTAFKRYADEGIFENTAEGRKKYVTIYHEG